MPHVPMTPQWLEKAPEGEWIDTKQRGLRLRVRSGRKVWSIRYLGDGRHVRYRIGEFPEVKLGRARQLAATALGRTADGDDPQAEKRTAREEAKRRRLGETVGQAIDSWLSDKKLGPAGRWKNGIKGGTWAMPHVRRLKRTRGDRLLSDLSSRDIERFVSEPEAPATRNRALTTVRLFCAWARRKHLLETDPTLGFEREHETERTRTLTDKELAALIKGFDPTRYGRAVRLLALTGLRRDEILGLRWEWVDTGTAIMTLPPEAEKTGRTRGEPRRVALSEAALELLARQREALLREGVRSDYVFATSNGVRPHRDALKPVIYRLRGRRSNGLPPSKDKRAPARKAVVPDDVTIHDIRRTVADALLSRLAVSPWVVDHVVLGHTRPKILRTYMPTLPLDEAREALDRWSEMFEEILSEPEPRRSSA